MKFLVSVIKTYVQEHIIEADDPDHAKEIGKEISDSMVADWKTFSESNWEFETVPEDETVTYTPQQNYLK